MADKGAVAGGEDCLHERNGKDTLLKYSVLPSHHAISVGHFELSNFVSRTRVRKSFFQGSLVATPTIKCSLPSPTHADIVMISSDRDQLQEREEDGVSPDSSCFPTTQLTPWLVFLSHGKRQKTHVFYSMQEDRTYVRNIPALSRSRCYGFAHGWLFMISWDYKDYYLLNLRSPTMERISIPSLPAKKMRKTWCQTILSSSPTDADCLLLLFECDSPFFAYYRPVSGDKKWIRKQYPLSQYGFSERIQDVVQFKGRVFGITLAGLLAEIDLKPYPQVTFMSEDLTPQLKCRNMRHEYKFVDSDGELFLVCKCYVDRWLSDSIDTLEVFKMDFSEMKWVGVNRIGDRAFFLCEDHSVSFPAGGVIRGDSIYYLESFDHAIYRFDMVSQRVIPEPFHLRMKEELFVDGLWIVAP